MDIGNIFRDLRQQKKITLHKLAVSTDIDATILSKIERNYRTPTDEQLIKLADFYNQSFIDLKEKIIAQKIINDYGLTETTLNAINIVQDAFVEYLKTNKNEQ